VSEGLIGLWQPGVKQLGKPMQNVGQKAAPRQPPITAVQATRGHVAGLPARCARETLPANGDETWLSPGC
jgi:hypothetical protein